MSKVWVNVDTGSPSSGYGIEYNTIIKKRAVLASDIVIL